MFCPGVQNWSVGVGSPLFSQPHPGVQVWGVPPLPRQVWSPCFEGYFVSTGVSHNLFAGDLWGFGTFALVRFDQFTPLLGYRFDQDCPRLSHFDQDLGFV